MEAKTLKADLSMIGNTVRRAEASDEVKALLLEMIAWNESFVDQVEDLDDRLESSEAALDEIIDDGGEMILPETAVQLVASIDHGQLLCQATIALLSGPVGQAMDEMSKKRFAQLIENAQRSFALSSQIIADLTAEEDGDVAVAEVETENQEETDAGGDESVDDEEGQDADG